MALPKVQPGEKESDFMERCMSIATKEYPQKQSIAICLDIYRQGQLSRLRKIKKGQYTFVLTNVQNVR